MNYEQAELRDELAGAYVLGTLRGRARSRFERSRRESPGLSAAVRRWEHQLTPLVLGLALVAPSPHVWEKIAARIGIQSAEARRRGMPWWWALVGAFAMSVLVTISIRMQHPTFQSVAAVGRDRLHPVWDISRSGDSSAITIRALQHLQSYPGSAYELWALPRDGKPAVSLGLLPRSGRIERALTTSQRAALLNANRVAVSLEPAGGSPTGSPTGPVLFIAELRQSG
jgi:anti-sigma-K factor RskA